MIKEIRKYNRYSTILLFSFRVNELTSLKTKKPKGKRKKILPGVYELNARPANIPEIIKLKLETAFGIIALNKK